MAALASARTAPAIHAQNAVAPPPAQTGSSKTSSHSSLVVPDIVENKREDGAGGVVCRYYRKGKLLGKGGFAKCYLFLTYESGKPLAGKCVSKESLTKNKARQKLLSEIKIHRSLHHPHIVGFDSFFEDKANVYIMLELCPNQTMLEFVKARSRLTEPEARFYALQLIDAVRYLHAHNIIHRDLKLGNLFLSDTMEIRVGDFGLATQLTHPDERKRTICGTPNYIAPEILHNKEGHSFEVDVWALGVIIYTMLVGKPPFETPEVKMTYQLIKDNTYNFPEHAPISEAARELITSILVSNPRDRPSLEAIVSHRWFTSPSAFVPYGIPVSALKECPRWISDDVRPGATVVRELLSKPIGGLLVKQSSRVPTEGRHQEQNYKSGAVRAPRLETVQDVSMERTRRTGSIDGGESASVDDEAASAELRCPTAHSLGGSSSASSLHSLRMAVARTTLPSNSWRQHAAAAAGDDKENAAPAGYSGMHPATAAAKRSILTEARPQLSLDDAEYGGDSGTESTDSGAHTRPDSASTSASWNRDAAGKRLAHQAPNSSLQTGAGQSFELADIHGKPLEGPTIPFHRATSAPMLVRPAATKEPLSKAIEVSVPKPVRDGYVDVENYQPKIVVAPEPQKAVRKALASVVPPQLPEVSTRPTINTFLAPSSLPTPTMSSVTPGTFSVTMPSSRSSLDSVKASSTATSRDDGASTPAASLTSPTTALSAQDTLLVISRNLRSPPAAAPAGRRWHGDDIVMSGAGRTVTQIPVPLPSSYRPKVWVSLWVDYTSKYGLAYLMTNGNVGVYFNDSTKVILSADGDLKDFRESSTTTTLLTAGATSEQAAAGSAFEYIDRAGSGKATPPAATEGFPVNQTADGLHRLAASLQLFPKSLEKKVKLLQYFKKYLAEQYARRLDYTQRVEAEAATGRQTVNAVAQFKATAQAVAMGCTIADNGLPVANQTADIFSANGSSTNGGVQVAAGVEEQTQMCQGSGSEDLLFVKKYVRTRRALLFRLSNRTFQASFYDGAVTLVHDEGRLATFTDAAGERATYQADTLLGLLDAMDSGASMPSTLSAAECNKLISFARRLVYTRDVIGQLANASRPAGSD